MSNPPFSSADARPPFVQRISATAHGARLARRLAGCHLDGWGFPFGSATSDHVLLVVAELAANAVLHGRVPGQDFELRLAWLPGAGAIRIEVADEHPGRPVRRTETADGEEGGWGLHLVDALAARWGVRPNLASHGKTVFAEVAAFA